MKRERLTIETLAQIDPLGTRRVETNSAGIVDGTYQGLPQQGSFPFGEQWYSSGPANKWFFTTYDRDQESGLDYALARYYNSRTGTFCSADPLAGSADDPQSWNRYAYGRGDPINITDPSGKGWLSWLTDIGIGIGVGWIAPEILPSIFEWGGFSTTVFFEGVQIAQTSANFYAASLGAAEFGGAVGAEAAAANSLAPAPPKPPQTAPKKTDCPISAASLDKYLTSKNSPMAGQGANLMKSGAQYNIDPRLFTSLAGAETGFGTNITAGQFNAFNVLYHGLNSPFASFQSAINSVGHSLTNPRNGYDFTNTSTLYGHYCSGTRCSAGLKNVNTFMNQQGAKTNSLHYPCKKE